MEIVPFQLQIAKSNRAKCGTCKEPIAKDSIKLVTESLGAGDFTMAKSFHVSCFKLPRKLKGVTLEEFVDEYLRDTSAEGDILPDKRDEILAQLEEAAAKAKPGKKSNEAAGGDEMTIMDRLKEAAENGSGDIDDENADDSKPPAKKKAKKGNGAAGAVTVGGDDDDAAFAAMLRIYKVYATCKVPELKDILRWNKQIMKGGKDFVLFKVIDGATRGRLGFCPLCQGNLKLEEGDFDTVYCAGRFDEEMGRRIACSYKVPRLDPKCNRNLPWYTEKPTDEEDEAMEKVKDEARGDEAAYTDHPVALELLEAAESMKLDLSTNEGKKKAATNFLQIIDGKLDLPENRNMKMAVGQFVISQGDKTSKEIMQALIEKYGIKDVKAAKEAAKEAAAETACANPKNAPLILAFKECSKYYFEEKNHNAGSTYVKAISTLMDLTEEVTKDNAMSFSKGKTKLPGIGKGTAEKMFEFVTTGTFAKLEEKRLAHSD